ncbi:hypothetical protein WA577_001758, partial [Blastocystis sp. JDR]
LGKVLIRCVHLLNTNESYPAYLRTAWSSFPIVASCIISFEWWGLFPCSCPRSLLSVLSQFLVVVVNPALSVLSYSFAAQSLLAPFAGLSIVWSLLFSTYLLPELPDKSKYRSTVLITLGCLLISLSASHSNATYTISDLSALSKQPSYILFSTLYFVSIVLLAFLSFG